MAALVLNHLAGMSETVVITFPDLGLLYSKRAARLTSHCTTQHNARTGARLVLLGSHETKAKLILKYTYDSHIAYS